MKRVSTKLEIVQSGITATILINGQAVAEIDGGVADGWVTRTFHEGYDKFNFPNQVKYETALGRLVRVTLIIFKEDYK